MNQKRAIHLDAHFVEAPLDPKIELVLTFTSGWRRARRLDLDLQRDLAGPGQGGRGVALAWRALRGRW